MYVPIGDMPDVTQILHAIADGDPSAAEELLPLIYDELRKLAAARMANESPDHTLQATALVHEAYVRLVDANSLQHWDCRGHFFSAAAEAMRRILVDQARRKMTHKAGGEHRRVELEDVEPQIAAPNLDVLALDAALKKLEVRNARQAELIKIRFFGGLTIEKAARAMGVSTSTVENDWAYARSWLRIEMAAGDDANLRR